MRKLSLSLILVVIVSIIGLGWILNQIYLNLSARSLSATINPEYLHISEELFHAVAASADQAAFMAQWNQSSHVQLAVIRRDNFPLPASLEPQLAAAQGLFLESENGVTVHFPLDEGRRVLAVSFLQGYGLQPQSESKLELLLTLCFYAGVIAIILIWIWPLIHQLIKLRDTAAQFGKGDLEARVAMGRFSYLRDIETEFNRMADRIQGLLRDNKLLSRAVSHDLKTPLARLRFGLEALTETDSDALRQKYAVRVNRDLAAMESLISTLLEYARLDESCIQLQRENLCLAHLVQISIETHKEEEISAEFACACNLTSVSGDRRYLSMLINNLLSNALRHASTKVLVSLTEVNGKCVLTFEDDGKGIPEDDREHAVKPFWRGDKGRGAKGHGMGLAIVARIAEWHGAALSIGDSQRLGGAAVSLAFAFSRES